MRRIHGPNNQSAGTEVCSPYLHYARRNRESFGHVVVLRTLGYAVLLRVGLFQVAWAVGLHGLMAHKSAEYSNGSSLSYTRIRLVSNSL